MSNTSSDSPELSIMRRSLLGVAIAAGASIAIGGTGAFTASNVFAATPSSNQFLQLSELLTGGKPLDAALAGRYFAALSRRDAAFAAAASALQGLVAEAKPASIDALLDRADLTDAHRKTITQIVSAWYLGIVGVDADAELVSYSQALMYRPTADVLVIPTYGGGPDSWGSKPAESPARPIGKSS